MGAKGDVKIVYIDGSLNDGITRAIRGKVIDETDRDITVLREDGKLTIGNNFIIKIEQWRGYP